MYEDSKDTGWEEIISAVILEREMKGVSQSTLSEMTGIKQSAISRMENLKAPPQLDTLIKILNALELKLTIQKNNILKEGTAMKIKTGKIAEVRAELLFCRITVTASQDDAFHLVTEEEREFFFNDESEGVLILGQRKRKLISKFFDWTPVRAELKIPSAFKGSLSISNKDGASLLRSLNINDLCVHNRNGGAVLEGIKARSIRITVGNGRVGLRDAEAADLDISTDNGRIGLSEIKAVKIKAESDNGRVTGQNVETGALDVKSDNGRIVFGGLKADFIKLLSKNGRIAASVIGEENEYGMEIEVLNGHSMIAGKKHRGSYIYKDKDRKKHISAYSKNGSAAFVFSDSAADAKSAFDGEVLLESEPDDPSETAE